MLLFWSLELSFTIQKSSLDFDTDRTIDVYFPPVTLNGKSACLQMNFTADVYFVVKIAYATGDNNEYKERMLFRSMKPLGAVFRLWQTTITPDMTEEEEFVVILHARSSSLGTMAIINDINLKMVKCNETGKCSHSIFCHYFVCCVHLLTVITVDVLTYCFGLPFVLTNI